MKSEQPPPTDPLPAPVADSHCHLDITEQYSGLSPTEALARAAAANVTRIVQVGTDVASSRWSVDLARDRDEVVAAVALHPNDAARLAAGSEADLTAALSEIEQLLRGPDANAIAAVGETGLDFYRTTEDAGKAAQARSFAAHIEFAHTYDKTLVIHDREAHEQILQVLDQVGVPTRFVMHCFSGDVSFARQCLDRGGFISFPGTITFKANSVLREAAAYVPKERILVETDAPFLTPEPHRGYPNAAYLLPHTVRFLATLRGVDCGEICADIYRNTSIAFRS